MTLPLADTALAILAHQLELRVITEEPLTIHEMARLAVAIRTVDLCQQANRSVAEAEAILAPMFGHSAPGVIAPATLPQQRGGNVVSLPVRRPNNPDGGSAA